MTSNSIRVWGYVGTLAALLECAVVVCAIGCGGSSTSSATVSAIAVSPSPCAVGRTDSIQMSALATLPNGTKEDITSNAETTWSSGNTNTATVDGAGTVGP
jgi:hypothetical protein